jgi:error-prone DNA polymerase
MTDSYIELHGRSAFSFLEGASPPEEMATECTHLEMGALAMLDRNGVYGAPQFHKAATKQGIIAHIGAELSVNNGWCCPLLVRSRAGYQNLCRMITQMKLRAEKGKGEITIDELAEKAQGMVFLTGGDDGLLASSLESGIDAATGSISQMVEIFGRDNVYVELQRHYDRAQESRNKAAIQIARRLRLPLLATNNACYAGPRQRELLDVMTCIHNRVRLAGAGRLLSKNSERYLKTGSEMTRLFADLPEAIANTVELSSRLEFTMGDLGYEFPKYDVPPGETMASFLRKRTEEGAHMRYTGKNSPSFERGWRQIERELVLIEKLGLPGYFLIVWDIINFCRYNGILVQGRGSAANSAVCYSLGITAVDPVGMELLFERFLSEERGEWPDIDLDLPSGDRRESVIQYVYERYGKLGAAMTANVITYRSRSAVREVGKVMGFDEESLGRLAKLASTYEYIDPNDTHERRFTDAGLNTGDPRIAKFMEVFLSILDLPRHLGQHSGGMIVCQGQLDSVVPLEPASMPGRVVVQWDKDDCADMGIIKIDLLGLGMMAVLQDSIKVIRDVYDEEVDLAHLPQGEPAVYQALQQADTVGMFQVESRAQMSCLPRLRPEKFYDIVVEVAIIRPGPIVGNMLHPYLRRRQGKEEPDCLHPSLEPVLRRTLGVPLFQEQLLRIAMICAGFTGGEAEELRRAMGFKRSQARMREIGIKLRNGMTDNGIDGETQDKIVQAITSFALYGFPESHAASFALIAYASAYLKCHYLAAFTATILNNQPMGFYQPMTLIKDAQRHGLRIKPIDITRSDWLCTVEPIESVEPVEPAELQSADCKLQVEPAESVTATLSLPAKNESPCRGGRSPAARSPDSSNCSEGETQAGQFNDPSNFSEGAEMQMRLGLLYVRGLRAEAGQAIVRERKKRPFTSIEDLRLRVPELRKPELRALAEIGALNEIDSGAKSRTHRRSALWQVERAIRPSGPLLDGLPELDPECPLDQMTVIERLDADLAGTGMTVGRHPMAHIREEMERLGVIPAYRLEGIRNNIWVKIAGCVIARQRPGSAKGFMFMSLEDETGLMNAIVTPRFFDDNRLALLESRFLIVEGPLQNLDGVINIKAQRVSSLALSAIVATASHDFH